MNIIRSLIEYDGIKIKLRKHEKWELRRRYICVNEDVWNINEMRIGEMKRRTEWNCEIFIFSEFIGDSE